MKTSENLLEWKFKELTINETSISKNHLKFIIIDTVNHSKSLSSHFEVKAAFERVRRPRKKPSEGKQIGTSELHVKASSHGNRSQFTFTCLGVGRHNTMRLEKAGGRCGIGSLHARPDQGIAREVVSPI